MRFNDISSGGEAPGQVTYGEAFTVQPFGNSLVTKTMTGDMIRRLLQQQFLGCGGPAPAAGRIPADLVDLLVRVGSRRPRAAPTRSAGCS